MVSNEAIESMKMISPLIVPFLLSTVQQMYCDIRRIAYISRVYHQYKYIPNISGSPTCITSSEPMILILLRELDFISANVVEN